MENEALQVVSKSIEAFTTDFYKVVKFVLHKILKPLKCNFIAKRTLLVDQVAIWYVRP